MDDDSREDESLELLPIERRRTPRGPVPGLAAEILHAPWAGQTFEVDDVGQESFFLNGDPSPRWEPGQAYKVRLTLDGQTIECRVECIRFETEDRTGAVMRLLPDQTAAASFLERVLEPSEVPPGVD